MTGQQTGHCHLKGHSHNWSHMGNFCARSSCINFYSTPPLTSVFSLLFFVVFLSGVATIFWGPERVFTTAASNRNYDLKKSQFFHVLLFGPMLYNWVTRWGSWLRHCATSEKVAGSIPEGVIGIFHWHTSDRSIAQGLTQPLIEMSTRDISWKPYHVRVPIVLKPGSLNLLEPSGPVQACNGIAFSPML